MTGEPLLNRSTLEFRFIYVDSMSDYGCTNLTRKAGEVVLRHVRGAQWG